ncbi:MAG: alpha/beta hydrolase [Bifidobacteriaceae bacterium]|jgi:pimeloyl-ACP methyl ester carboxylesterase|nr:alpha/beta hydrolase [Bifidobacteriaceae bacterium]
MTTTASARSYFIPGLHVEDRFITVPLDWRGVRPDDEQAVNNARDKGSLRLFYRVVTAPDKVHADLPLLIFLQGGPGGQGPRPLTATDEGWIGEAVKHFRVVLPDQRGTGRSSLVTAETMQKVGGARAQADYLKRFLADSIIADFEYLRVVAFGGRKWVSLGQSYGGFLTLSYLSLYPQALAASFTTGGIPGVPADADRVYQHTYPRVLAKTRQYYDRYPQDEAVLASVADRLAKGDVTLPNGDPFSVQRLQSLGQGFGMKPGFERVHWMIDGAFDSDGNLSDGFLMKVLADTSSAGKALYWTLQEPIYQDGGESGTTTPLRWSAARELTRHPEFDASQRPLIFTGEMCFPWMFEEDAALRPLKPAVDLMMEDTEWGHLYDVEQLRRNEVPLQAGVYYDDMYVDSGIQVDTLSRIGSSHYWMTNDFEHDGVHGPDVFPHLLRLARDRGDLGDLVAF